MSKSSSFAVWHLRRGLDRRFRAGHPWVYSNELLESPKGLEPGAPVELRDPAGKFLAWGYGNPHSLIAFRATSRKEEDRDWHTSSHLAQRLREANQLRKQMGFDEASYRLCYGEADGIPGLVIDRYSLQSAQTVFVVQAHTAGADRILPQVLEALETLVLAEKSKKAWELETAVVYRNDINVRKLEGLEIEPSRIVKSIAVNTPNLEACKIRVQAVLSGDPLFFEVDLIHGQKTGFFLDQYANIQLAAQRFQHFGGNKIRILDLCTYVGQWGAQLSRVFAQAGIKIDLLAVDASQTALDLAKKNIEAEGARVEIVKADVLKDLVGLEDNHFDLVISDPPALIKNRKDIPAGTHAYLQLATQVFRLVRSGGGVICCSCSALLEEESFTQVLAKAAARNKAQVRWVGRGAPSPDHPMLAEFPEGRYLKGWVGWVTK